MSESVSKQDRDSSAEGLEKERQKKLENDHAEMRERHSVEWWWRATTNEKWSALPFPKYDVRTDMHRTSGRTIRMVGRERSLSIFLRDYAQSAFHYELTARRAGSLEFEFGAPWPQLDHTAKDLLAKRWPTPSRDALKIQLLVAGERWPRSVSKTANRVPVMPVGWTAFAACSFNLNCNDNTLMERVRQFLAVKRKLHRIPNPKRNKGHIQSPIHLPWSWLELLDIKHHNYRQLTTSEGVLVSRAKSQGKQLAATLD